VLTSFLTFSCSSDDDSSAAAAAASSLTVDIDGVSRSYNTITATLDPGTSTSEGIYTINGSVDGSSDNFVEMRFFEGVIGTNAALFFSPIEFRIDGVTYTAFNDDITVNVTQNDGTKLVGSFSGTAEYSDSNNGTIDTKQISNGRFDVSL
jgi:hypothetical protein